LIHEESGIEMQAGVCLRGDKTVMEETLKGIAEKIALAVELIAALLIAYGALEALIRLLLKPRVQTNVQFARRRDVFLKFGVWMLLGLEFELAADIVRSAISPSWTAIGQLGAIAAIRTFLNYFLEKDIKELAEPQAAAEQA
jgi:uncharacterized membrane protein